MGNVYLKKINIAFFLLVTKKVLKKDLKKIFLKGDIK